MPLIPNIPFNIRSIEWRKLTESQFTTIPGAFYAAISMGRDITDFEFSQTPGNMRLYGALYTEGVEHVIPMMDMAQANDDANAPNSRLADIRIRYESEHERKVFQILLQRVQFYGIGRIYVPNILSRGARNINAMVKIPFRARIPPSGFGKDSLTNHIQIAYMGQAVGT